MPDIVLASASPRRCALMRLLDLSFRVKPADFDESTIPKWPPDVHVRECAMGKALKVAAEVEDSIVVAADTIVVLDELVLGKPRDAEDACRMLKLLSGRSHYVYTGLCVVESLGGVPVSTQCEHVSTEVLFSKLTDEVISAYVATGEPLDKAGAYGIQERGCVLVEGIIGDYFNVVGLPVSRLSRMLANVGIPPFR